MAQENENKIKVGNIRDVSGEINIAGGDIYKGFTATEVTTVIEKISSTFQPKPFDGRCPYKGLDVFDEEDAELFFGREEIVADLVERVKKSRTVFITGPSGSGKSSLVRAGLIPALKQGAIEDGTNWLYATIRPGREPINTLARAVAGLVMSTNADDEIRAKALTDETIFARWCEIALHDKSGKRVVFFVDQFEEVFTQVGRDEERVAFLNLLTHAATAENGHVIILFSMRSDFVSNCAIYPKLNELLNHQFIQVGAMQADELVSAIAQPALRVGLRIDPDLIAQIINDMQGEPGALPLMQFALKDLFDSRQEKGGLIALTLNDYLGRGGIHKSLERHADKTFAAFNKEEQELARSIFSSLIQIGRGTQDTRRIANFDELVSTSNKSAEVETIVRKLADARLITTDEVAGKNTITLAHEKLLDAWSWLKRLVNENRQTIAIQNEVAEHAKEWGEHKRDSSYLYSGTRLQGIEEWMNKYPDLLSPLAREFVIASQNVKRKERVRLVALGSVGVMSLLLTILALTGQLNNIIYRPLTMEWTTVPAGEFTMGSDIGIPGESPAHTVYLDTFEIGTYEITNKQYNQCVKAGICALPRLPSHDSPEHLDNPVVGVTWEDSNTFCTWTDSRGRLPTEAEWEKAARGTDQRTFPWGEKLDCTHANYRNSELGLGCVGDTAAVSKYADGVSPYGVYNMAGNAAEWVWDWYDEKYYQTAPHDNPMGLGNGLFKVVRGGSFNDMSISLRTTNRRELPPKSTDEGVGFRCARDVR